MVACLLEVTSHVGKAFAAFAQTLALVDPALYLESGLVYFSSIAVEEFEYMSILLPGYSHVERNGLDSGTALFILGNKTFSPVGRKTIYR